MPLPPALAHSVEHELARFSTDELTRAAADLTRIYHAYRIANAFPTDAHRAAYLAVRLPATFAVLQRVFEEIVRLAPELRINSLLDLGAGPGTALWAAAQAFPQLTHAIAVERDAELVALAKRLAANAEQPALAAANFRQHDVLRDWQPVTADLVVLSYALGELREADQLTTVQRGWESARQLLVVVEPGTPRGFRNLLATREAVGNAGAWLLAPCPRAEPHPCPMAERAGHTDEWCHFAARVERTSLHRRLKHAELGHEDEKFCYFVALREQLTPAPARIVRHPQHHSGHTKLTLCTPDTIEARTISRRNPPQYRAAGKAAWGDAWIE
jgi:ribosomal protein RSM22 (predicted rRNA methylase)